jgi:FeS assembly SUF system protein
MPNNDFHLPASLKSLDVVSAPPKLEAMRHEHPAPPSSELAMTSHVNRHENSGLAALGRNPLEEKIVDALRAVYDPELPVNIYDLGLIYSIDISADNRIQVKMTLTAPGCPVAGTLPPEVQRRIETVPGVAGATVELVWQPIWGREMMSEIARLELGL